MAKEDIIKHFRSPTGGRQPTAGELEHGEFFINYADGHVYIKDADDNIRRFRPLETKTFNITTAGQTNFPVLASATEVVGFFLNQLDYSEFVEINPAGSGNIVYDEVATQYSTEVGDYVKVIYF